MGAAERATCPYCGKRVALTVRGLLRTHAVPETGRRCARSGARPQ